MTTPECRQARSTSGSITAAIFDIAIAKYFTVSRMTEIDTVVLVRALEDHVQRDGIEVAGCAVEHLRSRTGTFSPIAARMNEKSDGQLLESG